MTDWVPRIERMLNAVGNVLRQQQRKEDDEKHHEMSRL